MRKLSKVLSILLAMVLVFSAASIGVEAQYSAYKDVPMEYDAIDQPVLLPEQYASMAMDELDRMLMKENIKVSETFLAIDINADFSTIDRSLDSIATIYGQFNTLLGRLGDVGNMDFSALLDCPRRGDSGATDLDIFKAVVEFLADNAEILKKVVDGTVDLGVLAGFINISDTLNIPELAKKAVAQLVWPEVAKGNLDLTKTMDEYVSIFIDRVFNGTYPKNKSSLINRVSEVAQEYLPGITDRINFMEASVYDIIETCARAILDSERAMSFINMHVRRWLHLFCGYTYTKGKDSAGNTIYTLDADTSGVKPEYEAMVNLNFTLTTFNTSSWSSTSTIFEHVNDIVGKVVQAAFKPSTGITWDYSRGNEGLIDNIRAAAEIVLEYTQDGLFASYVEVLPIAQVRAMTDDQFVAYILRSIMNGSIDSVYITSDVDSTVEVLFETVKSLAAEVVPSQDYSNLDADLDGMIRMGLDMAAYALTAGTSLALAYGLDQEEFAEQAMDWVITNYGGFVSNVQGTGWEALSSVFFSLIPANWLPYTEDGRLRENLDEIIFDDIIDNAMNFDIAAILNLLSRNPDGELNGTVVDVLLARITGIVNYIIPGSFPDRTYNSLETLLDTTLLGQIVEGLLTGLYNRFDALAESLLPLACSILDLSTPEEFGYPYVSLEDVNVLDPTMTDTFYIYNGSKGINTAWTDKYDNPQHQDQLYKYSINSIQVVGNDDITVVTEADASPAGTIINGGQSVNFKLDGLTEDTEGLLTIIVNYDVYGETGAKMTTQALTATNYVYVSTNSDDGSKEEKLNPVTTNLHVLYIKNYYLKTGSTVADLKDIGFTIRRNVAKKTTQHTVPATVTLTSVDFTEAPTLVNLGVTGNDGYAVSTKADGGVFDFYPYVVANGNENVIPDGQYKVGLMINATPTDSTNQSWNRTQRIWVYNDYGLAGYLRNAVRADRQRSDYGTTARYTASYIPFDQLDNIPENATPEQLDAMKITVNNIRGNNAWAAYTEALAEAARLMYAPRLGNTYGEVVDQMQGAAEALYTATQELEACSAGGGAAGVKSALNAIVPDDTFIKLDDNGQQILDEDGKPEKDTYPYYDARHTFFAREDYISYTYSRFKPEWRAAKRVISDWEDGETISAIEAAYATHRLNLYAGRLIRIRAYKEHLAEAIARFTPLKNAGKGSWSTDSWNDFTTAYQFATNVNNESIGSTISGTENLANDGLRQSKVNTARAELISAAKKLVEAGPTDFTALNALIAVNTAAYQTNGTGYTPTSFSAFKVAYEAAVAVAGNASATQDDVDAAYAALADKASKLEVQQGGDEGFTFVESEDFEGVLPRFIEETEESGSSFLVGLSEDMIGMLDEFIPVDSEYEYEIIPNRKDAESTGAQFVVSLDGEEIATYTFVFYGEVTLEGEITPNDVATIMRAANWEDVGGWEEYAATDEFAESFAADLNHDGEVATTDASYLIASLNGYQTINQNWTKTGDPKFL